MAQSATKHSLLLLAVASCVRMITAAATSTGVKAVVVMVIDDLGWHDLGFRGSLIRTPVLDSLRGQGIELSNYYVTTICTPSRSALLTGRYPLALGLQGGMTIQPMQAWGLPLNETTLPDILSANGVECHAVGKWHVGYARWEQTPTFRGFNSFYGYYLGAEDYYTHRTGPKNGYDLHRDASPRCGAGCSEIDWAANGTYSPFVFASEAQKVIKAHDPAGAPLFLYLTWQSVHAPIQAPDAYVQPYLSVFNNTNRATHAGMLAVLDEAVGNVTASLQEAGLLDDAVIVVTTDNGGPVGLVSPCGDCNGALNYPLRGGKHSLYEGGVRGTGWVWSKQLYGTSGPSGEVNRSYAGLSHITDWLPTSLSWLGLQGAYTPRPSFPLHGFDLSAELAAAAHAPAFSTSPRPYAILNIDPTCTGQAAVRMGDWKFILGDVGPPYGWDPATATLGVEGEVVGHGWVSAGDFPNPLRSACSESGSPTPPMTRLWPFNNTTAALYNVSADPQEREDLSAQHPDVVANLTALIASWAVNAVWPSQNATADPAGSSALHNGTWVPWLN